MKENEFVDYNTTNFLHKLKFDAEVTLIGDPNGPQTLVPITWQKVESWLWSTHKIFISYFYIGKSFYGNVFKEENRKLKALVERDSENPIQARIECIKATIKHLSQKEK